MRYLITGFFMGIADLIPGVSGGTIAFIFGVYEDFIGALSCIKLNLIPKLLRGKFGEVWTQINGALLFSILLGIALALFSLSSFIHQWLNEPISRSYLYAAFFGFIISSGLYLRKEVGHWSYVGFFLGFIGAFLLTTLTEPMSGHGAVSIVDPWFIFCGMVGSVAMLLPGISGSYLLVILGVYSTVIGALATFDLPVLLNVGVGIAIGFIAFSRLLNYLLTHYHDAMLSSLIGIMLGALPVVWPFWSGGARVIPSFDLVESYIALAIFALAASLAFVLENKSIKGYKKEL